MRKFFISLVLVSAIGMSFPAVAGAQAITAIIGAISTATSVIKGVIDAKNSAVQEVHDGDQIARAITEYAANKQREGAGGVTKLESLREAYTMYREQAENISELINTGLGYYNGVKQLNVIADISKDVVNDLSAYSEIQGYFGSVAGYNYSSQIGSIISMYSAAWDSMLEDMSRFTDKLSKMEHVDALSFLNTLTDMSDQVSASYSALRHEANQQILELYDSYQAAESVRDNSAILKLNIY